MKTKILAAALLALGLVPCAQATVTGTTTLTFDDIPLADAAEWENSIATLAPTYGGLSWDNVYVMHRDYAAIQSLDPGYQNGVVSGDWVAFNAYSDPASFFDGTAFTLVSAYVTRAAGTGNVHFDGYLGASLVHSMNVVANDAAPTFVTFNWSGVDRVTLSSDSQTVLDNLTVAAVPEPETYAMFLAGLGLMGVVVRRRRQTVR